jgi:hypothetical protein
MPDQNDSKHAEETELVFDEFYGYIERNAAEFLEAIYSSTKAAEVLENLAEFYKKGDFYFPFYGGFKRHLRENLTLQYIAALHVAYEIPIPKARGMQASLHGLRRASFLVREEMKAGNS